MVEKVVIENSKEHENKLARSLNSIIKLNKTFIVANDHIHNILAIWIAHTYTWQKFQFTPYLNIWSPERESGKSTVFSWLKLLSKNPFMTSGATASVIVRIVNQKKPTLLFDEVDAIFGSNRNHSPDQKEIIAFLNAGFEHGGVTHKSNKNNHQPEEFDAFCPKAFASIGADVLPAPTRSRSIHIPMARKTKEDKSERNTKRNRDKHQKTIDQIIKDLNEWSEDTACFEQVLDLPEELTDRGHDIYEPLFQIAYDAGADWLETFTETAKYMSSKKSNVIERKTELLIDCHKLIKDRDDEYHYTTTNLINALCSQDFADSGWDVYHNGNQIHPRTLKQMLGEYQIYINEQGNANGYLPKSFRKAIKQYALEHLLEGE